MRGAHEVERIGLGGAIGQEVHAAAARREGAGAILRDHARRPHEPRRVAEWAPGKREIARKVAEGLLGRVEVGAAEHAVHAKRACGGERLGDRGLRRADDLEVRRAAAAGHTRRDLAHRRLGRADVLEADVRHAQVAHGVDQVRRILDGAVLPGQHEDEVHG